MIVDLSETWGPSDILCSEKPVVIPRKVRLGTISDLDEVNAYMAHEDAADIARVDQINVLGIAP